MEHSLATHLPSILSRSQDPVTLLADKAAALENSAVDCSNADIDVASLDVASVAASVCGTPTSKRKCLSFAEKCEIIQKFEHHRISQRDLATEYGLDRSTITKILRNREQIMLYSGNDKAKRIRRGNYHDVEDVLYSWIVEKISTNEKLSRADVQLKALHLGQEMQHPSFQASQTWLEKFLRRRKLNSAVLRGEQPLTPPSAASISASLVASSDPLNGVELGHHADMGFPLLLTGQIPPLHVDATGRANNSPFSAQMGEDGHYEHLHHLHLHHPDVSSSNRSLSSLDNHSSSVRNALNSNDGDENEALMLAASAASAQALDDSAAILERATASYSSRRHPRIQLPPINDPSAQVANTQNEAHDQFPVYL